MNTWLSAASALVVVICVVVLTIMLARRFPKATDKTEIARAPSFPCPSCKGKQVHQEECPLLLRTDEWDSRE